MVKKILVMMMALGACMFSFSQDDEKLIEMVKAKLDRVNDYQASGKMKIDVSFIKAPQSTVRVFYKKPNRFKVRKEGGISILPKGGISINLNSLTGTDNFLVIPAGTTNLNGLPVRIIKLLPQDENNDIVLTTLYIDEQNMVIRKSKVTTRESGTYEIDMTFGKYIEWGLPDKVVFSFNTKDYKLPKGVTFEYDDGAKRSNGDMIKNKKGKVEITYSNYIINKGVDDAVFKTE